MVALFAAHRVDGTLGLVVVPEFVGALVLAQFPIYTTKHSHTCGANGSECFCSGFSWLLSLLPLVVVLPLPRLFAS